MLLLAAFLGAIVGYILMSLPKLGVIFIGIWLGILVTILLEDSILYKLGSIGNVLYYIVLAILCTIFALLTNLIFNDIIIICTSLLGVKHVLSIIFKAYLLIRPLGWFFGGFPPEINLSR